MNTVGLPVPKMKSDEKIKVILVTLVILCYIGVAIHIWKEDAKASSVHPKTLRLSHFLRGLEPFKVWRKFRFSHGKCQIGVSKLFAMALKHILLET